MGRTKGAENKNKNNAASGHSLNAGKTRNKVQLIIYKIILEATYQSKFMRKKAY